MLETIKEHSGTILLCAAFFVLGTTLGAVVGFSNQSNENGIYLSLSWGGKEVFVIGKNALSVSNLDLNNLSETDLQILVTKLEKLTPDHMLSKNLIELKDKQKGPFTPVDVNIDVRFINTERFSDQLAMACPASALYGRKILLHKIVSPFPEIPVSKNRIKDFDVVVPQDFSECTKGEDNSKNTVWVNRKMLKEWLDLEDVDLPYVSVTARIISILLLT